MVRRQRLNLCEALRDRIGDLARVPAGPDPRAVDAASATVDRHALDHEIQILLPLIDFVIADEDLGESRTMGLDARIAAIALDSWSAAENQTAIAAFEHRGADVCFTRVQRNGLPRNTSFEEGGCHPIRCPRLLWPGLENESDLHRNDGHPKRVNAG